MTDNSPVFILRGWEQTYIVALERAIRDDSCDTSDWPLNSVVFVECVCGWQTFWYAAMWDAYAKRENAPQFSMTGITITLSATDCYRDAFNHYAPVFITAAPHRIAVTIELRPSDLGFIAKFDGIDNDVYLYRLQYRNGNSLTDAPHKIQFCYNGEDDEDSRDMLWGQVSRKVHAGTTKFVIDHKTNVRHPPHAVTKTVVVEYACGTLQQLSDMLPTVDTVSYCARGWFRNDWVFTVSRHKMVATYCVTGSRDTMQSFMDACRSESARLLIVNDNKLPRVYPGLDRYPIASDCVYPPRFAWVLGAAIRMPYLSLSVVVLVLQMHAIFGRYEIIELLEWLPNMRFMTRAKKDKLVADVFSSIARVLRYRSGPSRSTRSRIVEK